MPDTSAFYTVVKGDKLRFGEDEELWEVTDVGPSSIVAKGRIKGAESITKRFLYPADFEPGKVQVVRDA